MAITATEEEILSILKSEKKLVLVSCCKLCEDISRQVRFLVLPEIEKEFSDKVIFIEMLVNGENGASHPPGVLCDRFKLRNFPSLLGFFGGVHINSIVDVAKNDVMVITSREDEQQREAVRQFITGCLQLVAGADEKIGLSKKRLTGKGGEAHGLSAEN